MKMWIGIVFLLTGAVLTAVDWPFCPGVPEVLRIQAERNQSIRPILQNRLQASRLALSSILQEPHWNVVEGKPLQPPSKNPHDYMSMGQVFSSLDIYTFVLVASGCYCNIDICITHVYVPYM